MKRSILLLSVLLAACGDDTGPQGTGGSGAGPSIQYQDRDLPRLPTAGKKRSVEQRNPFGNVEATRNLLWDGDFEWTSPFTDQYGWGELTGFNAQLLLSDVVIGAECRSGIKCARVAKRTDIFGLGVGSRDESLMVSVWVKLLPAEAEEASCADAHVALVDIGELSMADPDATIPLEGEGADERGWCHFSGVAPPRDHKPYLFVSNNSAKMPMLVDDVVLTAVSEGEASPSPTHSPTVEVPAERREHLEAMKSAVRAIPRLNDGRPNEAREAYERYMQHKRGGR